MNPTQPNANRNIVNVQVSGENGAHATFRVERYQIIGTNTFVHAAYAQVENPFGAGGYSTITSDTTELKTKWFGRLGTDELPAELAKMPRGDERYAAVRAWQTGCFERAYGIILQAFPEASIGTRSMGEIRTLDPVLAETERVRRSAASLAEALAHCTGAVAVTVTDGEACETFKR